MNPAQLLHTRFTNLEQGDDANEDRRKSSSRQYTRVRIGKVYGANATRWYVSLSSLHTLGLLHTLDIVDESGPNAWEWGGYFSLFTRIPQSLIVDASGPWISIGWNTPS